MLMLINRSSFCWGMLVLLVAVFFNEVTAAEAPGTLSNLDVYPDSDSTVLVVRQDGASAKRCHFREKLADPILSGDGKAVIVVNNKYVFPDGEINCKTDGYPGFWDLKTKKRMPIQSAESDLSDRQRNEEISSKCKELFQ